MAVKFMKSGAVIEMAVSYFPSFLRSRHQSLVMGSWMNGEQYQFSEQADLDPDDIGFGQAFNPDKTGITEEYKNLRGLSPNAFGDFLATSMAQMCYLEGISRPGEDGKVEIWETFLRNRWLSRQSGVYRAAAGQGAAYGLVIPGEDPLTRNKMSKMLTKSSDDMAAFYENDDDEWPVIAIEAYPTHISDAKTVAVIKGGTNGWSVRIWDDYVVHRLTCEGDGTEEKQWTYIDYQEHNIPVPPVARMANRLDINGRARGEIEPVLPLLRRIDQDTFDRLINQRFGAWQVRYIAGMAKPPTDQEQRAQAIKLRIEDLLVSTDHQTKFGTIPGGDIDAQIKATDHDLRLLSAITQRAPHHLLGLSSNLQAEALAAATEGMQRRAFDFRVNAGEFNEQMARLVAMAEGNFALAAAVDLRARFKDTESASMSQAADALGKLAVQLKVPIEMLWERIPGWNDTDVERAKELVKNGSIEQLINELLQQDQADQQGQQGAPSGNAQ